MQDYGLSKASVFRYLKTPRLVERRITELCPCDGTSDGHGDPADAPRPSEALQSRDMEPPPDPVLAQIRRWQEEGMSLRAIAAQLNAEGVPTRSGQGKWYQSNLSRLLARSPQRRTPHA